jgi:hypothetical protein
LSSIKLDVADKARALKSGQRQPQQQQRARWQLAQNAICISDDREEKGDIVGEAGRDFRYFVYGWNSVGGEWVYI